MPNEFIWLDGGLVPWADASVHVTTLGLHYGVGFFEGVRCHSTPDGRATFRLTDHLRRLRNSAAIYGYELPFSVDDIAKACRSVVIANRLDNCYIRPIVFLDASDDPFAATMRAAVIATENGPIARPAGNSGARARLSTFTRMSVNSLPPAAKATGQYLSSFLAQNEARNSGFDQAILLNSNGFVADGWAHNIFVVRDSALFTPPVSAGILAGVIRDTIIVLAREAGLQVRETDLVRTELYLADECFLTGTAAGIVPLGSVDGRTVGSGEPGPVTRQLTAMLRDVMVGADGAHPEWRESVA